MARQEDPRLRSWALVVIASASAVFLFYLARAVFAPTVLAVYLVLMLVPIHRGLHRLLPRPVQWLATPLAALVPAALLAVVGVLVWWSIDQLVEEGAHNGEALRAAWDDLRRWLGAMGVPAEDLLDEDAISSLAQQAAAAAGDALVGALEVFLSGLLVTFIVLLALSERSLWARKVRVLVTRAQAGEVASIVTETTWKVQQFLLWRTVTGLLSGAVVALLSWALGIGLVPVWFLLQWLSNYVPTIGAVVAGVLPALFALLTVGWREAAWLGLGITATEQVVGTFLGSRLQGRGLSLSPAVVLVGLMLFGWAWGVVGGLLSAPILATVHVVSRRVPALVPLAVVIGREPEEDALRLAPRAVP